MIITVKNYRNLNKLNNKFKKNYKFLNRLKIVYNKIIFKNYKKLISRYKILILSKNTALI